MKALITLVIVLVLGGGAYYFFMKKSPTVSMPEMPQAEAQTPASTPAPTPVPVTQVLTTQVAIANFAFGPANLTVKAGTKVTWTNNDSAPHTVTSDNGNTLNSGTLNKGQSYSQTFSTPGTYAYHCAFHPMMKAVITVTP